MNLSLSDTLWKFKISLMRAIKSTGKMTIVIRMFGTSLNESQKKKGGDLETYLSFALLVLIMFCMT